MDTSSESSAETTEAPPVADEPPDQRDRAQTHTPLPKPTNGPWFNFDEVAPRQWRKRMSEMSAWLDLQIAKGGDNTESILREFVSRFTGSLRDWYQALGEYRQLQLLTSFMVLDSDDSSSSEQSSLPDHDYPSEAYQATNKENSGPQIKIQILPTKYSKPIPVIAYFDTGAHSSMMNPSVLPAEAWKQENNQFLAADEQIFNTHLVSKHKIGLQFFPSFTLWTHVIGTPLPDKDILIGWDIYSQSKSIRILPQAHQTPQIPPSFPLEFIDTLSPGQTPTIQQIQHCTVLSKALPLLTSGLFYSGSSPCMPGIPSSPSSWANTISGRWTLTRPPKYAAFGSSAGPTTITHIHNSFEPPTYATNGILHTTTKGCTGPTSRYPSSTSFVTSIMTTQMSSLSSLTSQETPQGAYTLSLIRSSKTPKTRLTRGPVRSVGPSTQMMSTTPLAT
ncbi:hypothetical protein Ddye_004767 [Dipteronia dyeriana]|uniref:Polyprotein n=1 Tax=Dipteronia dyeriana TaxID=168575 RepID=A0AAD9XF02_9ROSI|nr:hypothetical protein Ddye_004767 [Dipteronia dyeriana]